MTPETDNRTSHLVNNKHSYGVNKIRSEGAAALALVLKANALEVLGLNGSEIGDEGITILAEALKYNSSLRMLK